MTPSFPAVCSVLYLFSLVAGSSLQGQGTAATGPASGGAATPPPLLEGLGRSVEQGLGALRNVVRAYEPNQVGLTKDKGDDWFLDFTLSLMIPVLPAGDDQDGFRVRGSDRWRWHPFAAMTLRAGQYLTRNSAPVVGKRFNPMLGARLLSLPEATIPLNFLELVYAHESNGQSLASEESFSRFRAIHLGEGVGEEEATRIARDNISRGWDYAGLKAEWVKFGYSFHLNLRVFMSKSAPQGEKEEYGEWEEGPGLRPRKNYDGIALGVTREWGSWQGSLGYTTGLEHTGKYSTWRAEIGRHIRPYHWRVFAWARYGYNSDLVDYFRRDSGWGLAVSVLEPRVSRVFSDSERRFKTIK